MRKQGANRPPLMAVIVGASITSLSFKGVAEIDAGISWTPNTAAIVLAFMAFSAWVILSRRAVVISRSDLWVLSIALVYLTSTALSSDVISAGSVAFRFVAVPMLLYVIVSKTISTEADYKVVVLLACVGPVIVGALSLVEFLQTFQRSHDLLGMRPIGRAGLAYFALAQFFAFAPQLRFVGYAGVTMVLGGFVASLSRVYTLYFVVSPMIYMLVRRKYSLVVMFGILFFGFSGTIAITEIETARSDIDVSSEGESTIERFRDPSYWMRALAMRGEVYREALQRAAASPIVGHGFDRDAGNRHNMHVELLESGGMVGYLLYLGFIFSHVKRCQKYISEDRYIAVNVVILVGTIVNSHTNPFLGGMAPSILFLVIALSEARISFLDKAERRKAL